MEESLYQRNLFLALFFGSVSKLYFILLRKEKETPQHLRSYLTSLIDKIDYMTKSETVHLKRDRQLQLGETLDVYGETVANLSNVADYVLNYKGNSDISDLIDELLISEDRRRATLQHFWDHKGTTGTNYESFDEMYNAYFGKK